MTLDEKLKLLNSDIKDIVDSEGIEFSVDWQQLVFEYPINIKCMLAICNTEFDECNTKQQRQLLLKSRVINAYNQIIDFAEEQMEKLKGIK